ncbi:juvenile hormone esterase-like isoform X1 [Diabrotica virgifera virgifera]|uniref:Carboxylesterase type B domain-containing protein n=2 Tax=Diabrotica virgifera virgifera TaxID=50390 RepID=A0ABM5KZJ3_DIAVI|nr:juvenile hormone esterase-like isoform X1 [Diabrotica virgifera virgifera]
MESPIVTVTEGQVRGCQRVNLDGESFYSFLGIPFAKPPLGDLRFKSPQPVETWNGVRDATKDGQPSYQWDDKNNKPVGSEDCLHLGIHTKKLPSKEPSLKPVMVWIHGGGFIFGSNSSTDYGPEYLMLEDIVLVSVNYRLGFLGCLQFEDTSLNVPGNASLKDQLLALKWIQQNIHHFNGDPKNVTIFGESAGGASIHYLMLSPSSKGLFHRAILQSGCTFCPWSRMTEQNVGLEFAQIVNQNIKTEKEALEVLRKLPANELLEAQQKFNVKYELHLKVAPTIEKPNETAVLTSLPQDLIAKGHYHKIPLMIGYTNMEGILHEIYQQKETKQGLKPDYFNLYKFVHPHMAIENKDPKKELIKEKLKKFYFTENADEMAKYVMATDGTYTAPVVGTAKLHAKAQTEPVYLYLMSLDAGLNFLKRANGFSDMPGACHADDLGYLFQMPLEALNMHRGEKELKAIRIFVKLWTNFAKFGNPTPQGNDMNITWSPVNQEEVNYLDIGDELTMRSNPEPERLKLWREIFQLSPYTQYYLQ